MAADCRFLGPAVAVPMALHYRAVFRNLPDCSSGKRFVRPCDRVRILNVSIAHPKNPVKSATAYRWPASNAIMACNPDCSIQNSRCSGHIGSNAVSGFFDVLHSVEPAPELKHSTRAILPFDQYFENGLQSHTPFSRSSLTAVEFNPSFVKPVQHSDSWHRVLHPLRFKKSLP